MNAHQNLHDLCASVLTQEALEKALAAARFDVRDGLFGPDYGLPQQVIASCLEETGNGGIDPGAIVREKLSRYVKERMLPALTDLRGRALGVDDFPHNGDDLTDDQSVPIVERLRQRLLENPSSGATAQCFEHHLHYGLGKSNQLTPAQVRFISSVCALASRRPHSILWLSQFVEPSLASPQRIRDLLTVIHHYRQAYPAEIRARLRDAFVKLVAGRRLTRRRSRSLRVLLVGYSRPAIEAVGGLAERSGAPILVTIADVQPPEQRWPQPTDALRAIEILSNVEVENASVAVSKRAIRHKKIDYIITGFKGIRLDGRKVSFVVSEPCAQALKAASGAPTILAGGLDKVWAKAHPQWDGTGSSPKGGQEDEVWDIDKTAWIATEAGVQTPDEFSKLPILESLFNAGDIEMFYALLISRGQESHKGLLAGDSSASNPGGSLDMPTSRTPPSKELVRQLKKYMSDAKDNSQFYDARAAFRKLVEDDEEWYDSYKTKYVAMIVDSGQTDQLASRAFWPAFAAAQKKWPGQMFYLGKVQRPLPPDVVALRSTDSSPYQG